MGRTWERTGTRAGGCEGHGGARHAASESGGFVSPPHLRVPGKGDRARAGRTGSARVYSAIEIVNCTSRNCQFGQSNPQSETRTIVRGRCSDGINVTYGYAVNRACPGRGKETHTHIFPSLSFGSRIRLGREVGRSDSRRYRPTSRRVTSGSGRPASRIRRCVVATSYSTRWKAMLPASVSSTA